MTDTTSPAPTSASRVRYWGRLALGVILLGFGLMGSTNSVHTVAVIVWIITALVGAAILVRYRHRPAA